MKLFTILIQSVNDPSKVIKTYATTLENLGSALSEITDEQIAVVKPIEYKDYEG